MPIRAKNPDLHCTRPLASRPSSMTTRFPRSLYHASDGMGLNRQICDLPDGACQECAPLRLSRERRGKSDEQGI